MPYKIILHPYGDQSTQQDSISVNGTDVPRMQLILKRFGFTEDQRITLRRWNSISR